MGRRVFRSPHTPPCQGNPIRACEKMPPTTPRATGFRPPRSDRLPSGKARGRQETRGKEIGKKAHTTHHTTRASHGDRGPGGGEGRTRLAPFSLAPFSFPPFFLGSHPQTTASQRSPFFSPSWARDPLSRALPRCRGLGPRRRKQKKAGQGGPHSAHAPEIEDLARKKPAPPPHFPAARQAGPHGPGTSIRWGGSIAPVTAKGRARRRRLAHNIRPRALPVGGGQCSGPRARGGAAGPPRPAASPTKLPATRVPGLRPRKGGNNVTKKDGRPGGLGGAAGGVPVARPATHRATPITEPLFQPPGKPGQGRTPHPRDLPNTDTHWAASREGRGTRGRHLGEPGRPRGSREKTQASRHGRAPAQQTPFFHLAGLRTARRAVLKKKKKKARPKSGPRLKAGQKEGRGAAASNPTHPLHGDGGRRTERGPLPFTKPDTAKAGYTLAKPSRHTPQTRSHWAVHGNRD